MFELYYYLTRSLRICIHIFGIYLKFLKICQKMKPKNFRNTNVKLISGGTCSILV